MHSTRQRTAISNRKTLSSIAEHRQVNGLIPLIPVVIWTCGLGGLLPAPFFAKIYKEASREEAQI